MGFCIPRLKRFVRVRFYRVFANWCSRAFRYCFLLVWKGRCDDEIITREH